VPAEIVIEATVVYRNDKTLGLSIDDFAELEPKLKRLASA